MQDNQLSIASVTGVDIELEIAGPGSRSYAFVVDWHIRLILALAWFVSSLLLLTGSLSIIDTGVDESTMAWIVMIPSTAIYLFYQPAVELLMRGRSPGKRIAGLRVVTVEGDTPGVGALLIRNAFRLVDSLPFFYIVGLVSTFATKQHVRIGDIAAGTLLVIDHDSGGKTLSRIGAGRNAKLDPRTADLIDEVLERWPTLQTEKRAAIAASLLVRAGAAENKVAVEGLQDSELHERLTRLLNANTTP